MPEPDLIIPPDERKTLLELKDTDCRWSIGDPRHADFHFCGKNKVTGLSWCEFHARRVFEPANTQRRRTVTYSKSNEFA